MTRTVLVFGDSNSHGTPPMADRAFHPRLARRWPVVMRDALGCTLIEDALPGRTACAQAATSPDVHLDGQIGLRIALLAHGPIDDLVIMLGTNDLQTRHGRTAPAILAGLAGLLVLAHDPLVQDRHGGFAVTLIAPPPVEETGTFAREFHGARPAALALTPLISRLAAAWGAGFLDAGAHIAVSPVDGVHFDAAAHETLGRAVAAALASSG